MKVFDGSGSIHGTFRVDCFLEDGNKREKERDYTFYNGHDHD